MGAGALTQHAVPGRGMVERKNVRSLREEGCLDYGREQESKQQTGTIGDLFVRDQNPTSDFCIKAKGSNKTSEISSTAHCPRF